MTLIGILGELGVGKTLSLTWFALRHIVKYHGQRAIYSNYHFNNIDYYYIEHPDQIDIVREGFCALDELWSWADSRTSASKRNRFISKILLKSRKRDMDIGYTAQDWSQVEKRIRKVTDLIALPHFNDKSHICTVQIYTKRLEPIKLFRFRAPLIYPYYDTTEEILTPEEIEQIQT
jgi:hypothetical protein